MRKDTWILILGCLAAPLACAQQHEASTASAGRTAATTPASRNPIGQALDALLRQARPAAPSGAADAPAATPSTIALAPTQATAVPQADASVTTSTANAVVVH